MGQRLWYSVSWRAGANRLVEHAGGHLWGLVRTVGPTGQACPVWNLEVHEDESYVADGVVVHNCQGYSVMRNLPWLRERDYPLLILPTRQALLALGHSYVIENVAGARYGSKGLAKRGLEAHGLQAGFLCGVMFGLPFYRHRYFESADLWLQPPHPQHRAVVLPGAGIGDRAHQIVFSEAEDARGAASWPNRRGSAPVGWQKGTGHLAAWQQGGNGAQERACGVGHAAGWREFAAIADLGWMTREEVCQSIPPAYTHLIGLQLRRYVA